MKRFLFGLVLMLTLIAPAFAQTAEDPAPVNYTMMLRWNENDPVELVTEYRVYVASVPDPGTTNAVNKMVTAPFAAISINDLLHGEPNGVYELRVTAVNSAGLESPPSDPIWIFWYARPTKPTGVVVVITPTP
jgi:hypothetical protein